MSICQSGALLSRLHIQFNEILSFQIHFEVLWGLYIEKYKRSASRVLSIEYIWKWSDQPKMKNTATVVVEHGFEFPSLHMNITFFSGTFVV